MNTASLWLSLSGILLTLFCGSGCGRPRENITLAGSTAFQPFAEKLADQYMTAHPEVSITIQGGGSALGIHSAVSGAAQVGMADLVTLPKEADGLKNLVVARDGIVIVVNPKNTVANLTLDQVKGIFSGAVANWKEVGGPDHAISVISREAGSGTRSSFEQIIGGIRLAANALIQDSNGTIRETVANDAYAVGYLSHGLVNEKIKPLSIDGYPCRETDIMSGAYRLVRPIFLVYRTEVSPDCQKFLDYVLTPEAQSLLSANGLIRAK